MHSFIASECALTSLFVCWTMSTQWTSVSAFIGSTGLGGSKLSQRYRAMAEVIQARW